MWMKNNCEVCDEQNTDCVVIASTFGPYSYACCSKCLSAKKEPYHAVVDYIACAGRFPDDINEIYQTEVRRQLELHNITEDKFIVDVNKAMKEMNEIFNDATLASYREIDVGDFFE